MLHSKSVRKFKNLQIGILLYKCHIIPVPIILEPMSLWEDNEMEISLPDLGEIPGSNNSFGSSFPAVDVSQEGQALGSSAAITNVAISQVVGINIARSSINSETSFASMNTSEETSQQRSSRLSLRGRRTAQPNACPLQRLHSTNGGCPWCAQRMRNHRN